MRHALDAAALDEPARAAAARTLMQIARAAEAAPNLDGARRALELALQVAPGFADLHHAMGRLQLEAGRPDAARASFDAALQINPRYVAARAERALLDAREGRLAEALATFQHLGEQAASGEPRLFRQGLESLEHADWDRAGAELREALHLDEPGIRGVLEAFHDRMARGDRAAAAALVRQALPGRESYADLHCLLGTAELEEGRLGDALCSLARALEIHPDYHAARVQLARALEALGDLAQAEEQIALVLQAEPGHSQALELRQRWSRMRRRRRSPATVRKAS